MMTLTLRCSFHSCYILIYMCSNMSVIWYPWVWVHTSNFAWYASFLVSVANELTLIICLGHWSTRNDFSNLFVESMKCTLHNDAAYLHYIAFNNHKRKCALETNVIHQLYVNCLKHFTYDSNCFNQLVCFSVWFTLHKSQLLTPWPSHETWFIWVFSHLETNVMIFGF